MRRGVARAVGAAAVFSIPVIALALVVGMPESPLVVLTGTETRSKRT